MTINSASGALNRRDALKLASLATLAAGTTAGATLATASSATAAAPKWTGHVPGKIHLGWASGGDVTKTQSATGPVGLRRTYFDWSDGIFEDKQIQIDHAAYRLPWISFKPPVRNGGWRAVVSGQYDADIRARARRYARYSSPVIVTFSHEPHTLDDRIHGTPAEFAAAWSRIHDIMKAETGLKNVASVPIIGEWAFNKYNKHVEPEDFITAGVLNRCSFLGVDLYQNRRGTGYAERLGGVLNWLDARGRSDLMVGIGETGATNAFRTPDGAAWWTKSWKFAAENTSRVGAISYWNSDRGNNLGHNWMLWETSAKLAAYKSSLAAAVTVKSLKGTQWVGGGKAAEAGTAPANGSGTSGRPGASGTSRRNVGAL